MDNDLKKLADEQRVLLTEFSMEQDKTFNRYVVLGSAASVTLLINLLSKNPQFFEHSEYMKWAFWGFSISIVISAFCLFINARLSDRLQFKYARLSGFLAGSVNDDEALISPDVKQKYCSEILENNAALFLWSRRIILGIELFAGLCFCFGIGISMYEIGKVL